MRIRQVRREFWSDRRIALLSKSTRLFYIGLWCLSDDDGYLRSDLPQIAGELFPWDGYKHREREAERDWATLLVEGRVVALDCGIHARIPTLPEHQKVGGERIFNVRTEHQKECSVGLQSPMGDEAGNGKGSNGKGRGAGEGSAGAAPGAAPRRTAVSLRGCDQWPAMSRASFIARGQVKNLRTRLESGAVPEDRDRSPAPDPGLTTAEIAQQLADDEEFREAFGPREFGERNPWG